MGQSAVLHVDATVVRIPDRPGKLARCDSTARCFKVSSKQLDVFLRDPLCNYCRKSRGVFIGGADLLLDNRSLAVRSKLTPLSLSRERPHYNSVWTEFARTTNRNAPLVGCNGLLASRLGTESHLSDGRLQLTYRLFEVRLIER
jgi:hypothetical protein